TPVALHLIFNILLDCSPPTNLAVSLTTLSDWNVLSGEADKLILRKHFSNYNPPTNLAVSLTTLSDWNVLSCEADKLISRKHFSNYKYDFHLRSDDSPT
ncbi:hypothetical protein pdam_00012871, partial [Pocillopora damicornis]